MSYYYWKSEPNLWTVGTVGANGHRETDSDHGTSGEAAVRVHYLNGGADAALQGQVERLEEQNRLLTAALTGLLEAVSTTNNGGFLEQMSTIEGRITWYERAEPRRQQARAALAAQEGTGG